MNVIDNFLIKLNNNKKRNVGSSEFQIINFTKKINELQNHFKIHKKDNHSLRGLIKLVSKRKKLLKYLKNNNFNLYLKLINILNIRK